MTLTGINIINQKFDKRLSRYIRRISIFKSVGRIKYNQKLTPSAFSYLSYNQKNIPVSIIGKETIHPQQRLVIAGPKISENIYVKYDGILIQILIEFTGSGFYYLFKKSPETLLNGLVDLKKFISCEECNQLEETLLKQENENEQVKHIERFLLKKGSTALRIIDYIEKSLNIIEENHGNITVSEISKKIGISERQFNRRFVEVVGISPKKYAKIFQLHYIIYLMHTGKYPKMQDIAYESDLFDPSHLIHKFKELTGFTPTEFIHSSKHIALKYFTEEHFNKINLS